jgi:hypothetical protein
MDPTIARIAEVLTVDLRKEAHFLWLVELAAEAELPSDWKEVIDEQGSRAYYHPKLKLLQKDHPVLHRFKQLYSKQKVFIKKHNRPTGQLGEEKIQQQLGVILNEVFNRAHKELPPVTPELVETLCLLLNVDSTTEARITQLIKQTCDLFVERRYAITQNTQSVCDPAEFLAIVRRENVRVGVIEKPMEVVFCQECEKKSAKIKCEQCRDFFCKTCFAETHATGKRKAHSTIWLEQDVCGVCDERLAESIVAPNDPNDAKMFCEICYVRETAEHADLKKLPKKLIHGVFCLECHGNKAEIICEHCVDLFCAQCHLKVHRKGRRAKHNALYIDQSSGEVWRAGNVLPAEDAQGLIDKARVRAAKDSPWVSFKDDNWNVYWFNFADKARTNVCPFNN